MATHVVSTSGRRVAMLAIVTGCVGCDQATKYVATQALQDAPAISFFGDMLHLGYALNPGGFLGLGGNVPAPYRQLAFIGVNALMMAVIAIVLIVRPHISKRVALGLTLVLAGGLGNLVDRVCNEGLVTDFIVLACGPLRTGVFNVADVAVTVGVLLLASATVPPEAPTTETPA